MKDSGTEIQGGHIFEGEAGVVEHGLVRVDRSTLWILDDNCLRYGIGNAPKLALVLPQFLFRAFAVFNVGTATKPVDDFAFLVAKGSRADQEPSVFPIETPQTRFHLTRLPRSHDRLKLDKEPLEVFGMICNFPSPTGLCSLGQARIVVPSLVMEFIGTIRQSAPHKRGDRVDHHPEFVFGYLHFVELLSRSGPILLRKQPIPFRANERLQVLRRHHPLLETMKSFRQIDCRPLMTSSSEA